MQRRNKVPTLLNKTKKVFERKKKEQTTEKCTTNCWREKIGAGLTPSRRNKMLNHFIFLTEVLSGSMIEGWGKSSAYLRDKQNKRHFKGLQVRPSFLCTFVLPKSLTKSLDKATNILQLFARDSFCFNSLLQLSLQESSWMHNLIQMSLYLAEQFTYEITQPHPQFPIMD